MSNNLHDQIEQHFGQCPHSIRQLGGGMIGRVYQVVLPGERTIIAKVGDTPLSIEGYMLRYLAEHSALPVPDVLYSSDSLLLIEFVVGSSHFTVPAQRHAAQLLAALHEVSAPLFGLERDTLIGSLHQPNPWTESWVDFFREHRLIYMAGEARRAGMLPDALFARLEKLAAQIERWLIEPDAPSLIHGDIWATNVLAVDGRITAFIDPAIYYGHAEMELAYVSLFNTFDSAFFQHYHRLRPLAPGFGEERRDLYNLYPLLVHMRLFGGGYVGSVERIVQGFGF